MHLKLYFTEALFTSRAIRCEFLKVLHTHVFQISSQVPSKISAVLFFFLISSYNNIIWFFGFWKWAFKITGSCQSWTIISIVEIQCSVLNWGNWFITLCFMWITYFCFTIHYSVFTTKGYFCLPPCSWPPFTHFLLSLHPTLTPAMAFFSKMISP